MNCNALLQTFNNSSQTVILVDDALRARMCEIPLVTVVHKQPDGTYLPAIVSVALNGIPVTEIVVDHGGPASGIIKIQ